MVMSSRDGTLPSEWAVTVPRIIYGYAVPVSFMYAAGVSQPAEAETLVRAYVEAPPEREVRTVGILQPET